MTMTPLPLGASAAGLALLIISGCATCGPRTCPAADAAIQQLQEVTTVLEAGYVQGEASPESLEEAMGVDLPIELDGGGVLRRSLEGSTRDYILEGPGEAVFVQYGLADDARRTPLLSFGYFSRWGSDSCHWSAESLQSPEWQCIRS